MNFYALKEIRRHGEELFPVGWYDVSAQNNLRYLTCHWHDEMELFRIQEGSMKIRCGDDFFFAEAGSIVFFPSGVLHAADPVDDEKIAFQAVVFRPEFLCDNDAIRSKYILPIVSGRLRLPAFFDFSPTISAAFDRLFPVINEKPFGYELEAKALLLSIFFQAIRVCQAIPAPRPASSVEHLKAALQYIQTNYKKPLSIEELSILCGMSQGHFCRVFKQYTLKTPVQYINSIRVSKAIELLSAGNQKILDIALDTGFNGLSYFISVFKETVGKTPSQFRRDYGNPGPAPESAGLSRSYETNRNT